MLSAQSWYLLRKSNFALELLELRKKDGGVIACVQNWLSYGLNLFPLLSIDIEPQLCDLRDNILASIIFLVGFKRCSRRS